MQENITGGIQKKSQIVGQLIDISIIIAEFGP